MSNATPQTPAVVVPELPDYLKSMQSEKSADAQSMADSSISIPRVSLKAKFFRLIVGGEEIKKFPEAEFVIIAVDPGPGKFIKTYYQGAYTGESIPPTCSSQDGIRPDGWVSAKQAEMCNTCPQNRFGSATSQSGKKTKACRDSKRLWVALPDDIAGTVFGLNVPVTSLKNLSELGRRFGELNVPISAAVVKMTMDEDESYPILNFAISKWLDAENATAAIARNTKRDWEGAIRSDSPALAAPTPQPAIASPQVPPQTAGTPVKTGDVDQALKNWGGGQ